MTSLFLCSQLAVGFTLSVCSDSFNLMTFSNRTVRTSVDCTEAIWHTCLTLALYPHACIRTYIHIIYSQYNSQCPSRLTVRVHSSFDEDILKLHSDCGNSGSKKCKCGHGGAYGGVWQSLRLAGFWSQAVGFVLVRLAGIWLQSP
jgi:hypothetical protein